MEGEYRAEDAVTHLVQQYQSTLRGRFKELLNKEKQAKDKLQELLNDNTKKKKKLEEKITQIKNELQQNNHLGQELIINKQQELSQIEKDLAKLKKQEQLFEEYINEFNSFAEKMKERGGLSSYIREPGN